MAKKRSTEAITPFAVKLRELRDQERIRYLELTRMAGMYPKDLARLQTGVSPRTGEAFVPTVPTIRKLARGLAMDPFKFDREGLEVVDEQKERRYFRELMSAAGYLDGLTAVATELPPSVVRMLLEHPEIVGVHFDRDGDEWTPEAERQFLEALGHAVAHAKKGLGSKRRESVGC
jgi:transcriptional regulator with XRE-family HTH domain